MFKLKLPLLCFIIVFVFSSFLGLINGVVFFKLLFRALISGCVAAAFAFGAREILERYIPELFEKENEKEFDAVAQTLGSKLNINIDDEEQNYLGAEDTSEDIFEESGKNEGLAPAEAEPLGADESYEEKNEAYSENDLSKEPESVSAEETQEEQYLQAESVNEAEPVNETAPINEAELANGASDDNQLHKKNANADENVIEAEPAPAHADENAQKPGGALEELPDMQEFEPEGEVAVEDRHVEDFTETGTDPFLITGDSADNKTDAALIAKAVQTLLRQES